MQKAFDRDKAAGLLHARDCYGNATDDGTMGCMLMVQTGDIDTPIDWALVSEVTSTHPSTGHWSV